MWDSFSFAFRARNCPGPRGGASNGRILIDMNALTHERVVILSTGDELSLGQKIDTNSQWLAERLTAIGVHVDRHVTLGDDRGAIRAAIDDAVRAGVALVVMTGGLGPTLDDLTRQALADVLGERLVEDAAAFAHLDAWIRKRGRAMSDLQRLQALRPESAAMLANPNGTAPGLFARVGGRCDVFCLPGPPLEMKPMFEREVAARLNPPAGKTIATRALHTIGLPEADVGTMLGELMQRGRNPSCGTTASGGVITCRLRFEGDGSAAEGELDELERRVRAALGHFIFGDGEETLAHAVVRELTARGAMLVTAESCTGGLLGSMLTAVPGSSAAYVGGVVSYANELKSGMLGVEPAVIERHGAVSAETAGAMARGAIAAAERMTRGGPLFSLAITGIAGPGGGTDAKPVGTVFIGLAERGGAAPVEVRRFHIPGDRAAVRDRSAKLALAMLRFRLVGAAQHRLLWQSAMDGSALPA